MNNQTSPPMIVFHVPSDPELLQVLGEISLRHSHLDRILRMMMKTLGDVTVQEALDATALDGSAELRRRICKLARQRFGEGNTLIRIQSLVARCRQVTERRNELIHNIWAKDLDGDAHMQTRSHERKPIPTVGELKILAGTIEQLVGELNYERLEGFICKAMNGK